MKKIVLLFHLFIFFIASSQSSNKYRDILQSENIIEVESFLKDAHPDDPRRMMMKTKLVKLKNAAWIKTEKKEYQTTASRLVTEQNPIVILNNKNEWDIEKEEYNKLLTLEKSDSAKSRKIDFLNQLFTKDSHSKEAIILIKNNSKCNIIMNVSGKELFKIPVSSYGENSFVIEKGDYQFTSTVCELTYKSSKIVNNNTVITLNYSPIKKQ